MFLSFMWPGSKDKQVYKKALQRIQKIYAAVEKLEKIENERDVKQALICYAVLSNPEFNAAMKKFNQSDSMPPSNSPFSHKDEFVQALSAIGHNFDMGANGVFHAITDSKSINAAKEASRNDESEFLRLLQGKGKITLNSVLYSRESEYAELGIAFSKAFKGMNLGDLSKIVGLTSSLSLPEQGQKFILSQKYGVPVDYEISENAGKVSVVAKVPIITVNLLSKEKALKQYQNAIAKGAGARAEITFTIDPKAAPEKQVNRTIKIMPADPVVIAGLSKIRDMQLAKNSPIVSSASSRTSMEKPLSLT